MFPAQTVPRCTARLFYPLKVREVVDFDRLQRTSALIATTYITLGAEHSLEGLTPRPPDSEFATDVVTSHGHHIQIPYYKEEEMEIALKKMLDRELEESLNKFREIADRIFHDPREMRFYKWPSLGVEVVSMRLRQLRNRPEEFKDAPMSSFMGNFNINMFGEILKESEIRAKEVKAVSKDVIALQEKVDNLAESLIEAFRASPTSTNVDFQRMRIDGELFHEHVADLMSEMRNCDFGPLLKLIDKTINLLPGM